MNSNLNLKNEQQINKTKTIEPLGNTGFVVIKLNEYYSKLNLEIQKTNSTIDNSPTSEKVSDKVIKQLKENMKDIQDNHIKI